MPVYVNHVHVSSYRGQRASGLPELELWAVVNQLMWVLGIKLRFSARIVDTLITKPSPQSQHA